MLLRFFELIVRSHCY